MQKESHNSELLSVQEIVFQLTALLPSLTDNQSQHTLLTCMEQMHRNSSRQHYQCNKLQRQCAELTQLVRERNIEIRSLKKQRKKNSQHYELAINKDELEIDRLKRRCDEAEDQLRSLRDSRKHSQYQNLLRENKKLSEELFELKKNMERNSIQDTVKASPTQLEACRKQITQLTHKLKQVDKLDRHFGILKEDHHTLSNILKNRDRLIEQLQTTVIDQRAIITEQQEQLKEQAEMHKILDDTLGTDDTSIHDETSDDLLCLLEVEPKDVRKRKKNRRRQHRKLTKNATSTQESPGSDMINPDELPPVEPIIPTNVKALLVGLVMSFMMLFSL